MKILAFLGVLTLLVVVIGAALMRWSGLGDAPRATTSEAERPPDALLSQRLAIATGALQDAAGTRLAAETHFYAQAAIDAMAGPVGRHGRPSAPPGGIFPEDAAQIGAEPGLALRAYDAAPQDSRLRQAVDTRVVGGVADWRTPRSRYDAIDRAVAEYRPDNDTIAALPGASERALAWALLVLQTEDVNEAHARAQRGATAARQALDAVRIARASAQ